MSIDATYQILSRLVAPRCRRTSLDWRADKALQSSESLPGVLRYVKEQLSPTSSPTKATVKFSVGRSYHVEGSGWAISLHMKADELEQFVRSCLKPHGPIPTTAMFTRTFTLGDQISWIDGLLPSITNLLVEGTRDDVPSLKSILEYMSSADRPAFACLRRLQINYRPQLLEEIKSLLRHWTEREELDKLLGLVGVPDEINEDLQASYPDIEISRRLARA